MSILDRAIEIVSPSWALRRTASRAALDLVRGIEGGRSASYRGGVASRLDNSFPRQPQITGQRLIDRYEIYAMRDRSRNVDANNPIGHGMLNRLTDNVIGEGFTLQAKTGSKEFNAEAEERFREWFDHADIRGLLTGTELQRLFYRAHERDGDAGIIKVSQRGKPKVQMIEAEQIRTPDGGTESPTMNSGVEMDKAGRPIRFHVLESPEFGVRRFRPISANNFLFFPRFKRFNQVRGEPAFAQTFSRFDQLDGYIDAVVVAARMAAIFGLVFKEASGSKQLQNLQSILNAKGDSQKAITLENGMAKYIGNQDDIVQVQAQQPMQQTPDFIAAILRIIGLPLDMPLELSLLDFSRVNYSSARASFLQFYQAMRPKQEYFRSKVLSPLYHWWIGWAANNDVFTTAIPENYWKHHFMARGWQWVDPLKDAQALLLEISLGVNSPQRGAARLGRDYEEIMMEVAAHYSAMRVMEMPPLVSTLTRDALAPKTTAPTPATSPLGAAVVSNPDDDGVTDA